MLLPRCVCTSVLGALLCLCVGGVVPAQTQQRIGEIEFTVADGLQVTKVASEKLIRWPVVADWDQAGRLVIVETVGVERPIQEHNEQRLHRVVRLTDEDRDGIFDSRIVAADQLPFTEGVLALGDDLLVSAPPNIWRLVDADGDGVCERREVWFDGQTITGCANDLHGPYLGRDGWIYWCKGAFAEQTHVLADGKVLRDKAAHIYRRRIEGGALEPVISGGMDNPVEVAFSPAGEKFFTSTFLQHPGNGRRDGLGHAVYGSVFGKDHSVLDGLVRTGPLMPIMTHLGPAAPSGLTCLESEQLVSEYVDQGNLNGVLVAALFNLQKVSAHQLVPDGASFATKDIDLMVADRIDFHPTDILEDADGSLLVLDTGGWYDLCCPTSRVDQKVAEGGIYRISKRTSDQFDRQNITIDSDSSVQELCERISDHRPWVRRSCLLELRRRGDAAVPLLASSAGAEATPLVRRLQALWALSFVGSVDALSEVAKLLHAKHPVLVQAACSILAVHQHQPAASALAAVASSDNLATRRSAVEALGRLKDPASIPVIFQAADAALDDRHLDHAAQFALIEIGDAAGIAVFMSSSNASERRLAALALEQLHDQDFLRPEWLFAIVTNNRASGIERGSDRAETSLRTAAIEILVKHPEWSARSDGALAQLWSECNTQASEDALSRLRSLTIAWRGESTVIDRMTNWLSARTHAQGPMLAKLLESWAGVTPPADWVDPIVGWIHESPMEIAEALVGMDLTSQAYQPVVDALRSAIEGRSDIAEAKRLLAALPRGETVGSEALVSALLAEGDYGSLARLKLSLEQAQVLMPVLEEVPSPQLPYVIEAIASAGVENLNHAVLLSLRELPAARTLSEGFLENTYRQQSQRIRDLARVTELQLRKPPMEIAVSLSDTLARLGPGDQVRGLQLFRSAKANCVACHQMGYVGGNIGPELTRIGGSRTREALLEAILFPSARIEQSYQPERILTIDGQVYNGLARAERDAIEVQIAADRKVRIALADIEQREISQVSIMPAGMHELLSMQEIADLLALLESAK